MTSHQKCILVNYSCNGGMACSQLTSVYCCKRLSNELKKDPQKKKFRHSIGGIHKMDDKPDNKGHWLKRCTYCNARIVKRNYKLPSIPYNFITQVEIQNKMKIF